MSDKRFKCPECGSDCFGSQNIHLPNDEWARYCKGYTRVDRSYTGCTFRWISGDDDKYFVDHYSQEEVVEFKAEVERLEAFNTVYELILTEQGVNVKELRHPLINGYK